MERKLRYAWWFALGGLVIFAVWKLFLPHGSSTNAYLQKTVTSREIVVYVAGAVEKPELVHLAPDARLDDALKQVHPLPEANLESMNPAEKLKDGQKVSVPFKSLPLPTGINEDGNPLKGVNSGTGANTGSISGLSTRPVISGSVSGGTVNSGSTSPVTADGKININIAGTSELDKLSGVGPALAGRIIQYRTEHGPFARPEDLQNVSGIGVKTYEKMASQVTVTP